MFERDYILRMVEQIVQALARIAARRKEGRLEEADLELGKVGEALLGARPEVLLTMPESEVIALLTVAGKLDDGKAGVLARLWAEQAPLCDERGKPGAALLRRLRALSLWTYVERHGSALALESHIACRADVVQVLTQHEPLPDIALTLHAHEDAQGHFARAEDLLYAARSLGADCQALGDAFYARLTTLDDALLDKGDLPRDEVLSGAERWTS